MTRYERGHAYPELYFKNGKPKKKHMLCYDKSYIRELHRYYPDTKLGSPGVCGGLRCPLYTTGCD